MGTKFYLEERLSLDGEDDAGEVQVATGGLYRPEPAIAISATSDTAPVAARFVRAPWRASWNGRT
jgi:hypothetical protein